MQFEMQLLWAAVVSYVLAGCIAIFGVMLNKRPERTVLGLLLLALALHSTALGLRWERVGHGPYITMFEFLSSSVWSMSLIFTLAYWRYKPVRPIAAIIMPIMFMMMGWMMLHDPAKGHLSSIYHTVWLFIHIGFAKLFSGTVLVALGIAGVILLRGDRNDAPPSLRGAAGDEAISGIATELTPLAMTSPARTVRFANLPGNDRLDELAYRFMALGLVFDTLMLISGAIWAQDAFGRYWSWDSLETWSLITWITLALALHLRLTYKLSPRNGALMIILVFVFAFFTFFGAPFVSTTTHRGAL